MRDNAVACKYVGLNGIRQYNNFETNRTNMYLRNLIVNS